MSFEFTCVRYIRTHSTYVLRQATDPIANATQRERVRDPFYNKNTHTHTHTHSKFCQLGDFIEKKLDNGPRLLTASVETV